MLSFEREGCGTRDIKAPNGDAYAALHYRDLFILVGNYRAYRPDERAGVLANGEFCQVPAQSGDLTPRMIMERM
jgi:hypothetical protein